MSLKLNSSGGGSVLLQEPNTASNVTFTLPSETATAVYANASGNVGIGTSSPAAPLDIARGSTVAAYTSYRGNGNASASEFFVGQGGNNYGYIYNRANGPLEFATNNTAQALITATGLFQFNSGYGSVATAYGCRAWVNFNGTGTVSITASGNVSSITDNGVGNYTVNFANAMSDANYNFVTNSSNTTSANILCIAQLNWDAPTKTTSALRIYNLKSNTGALTDQDTISVSIFR